MTDGMALFDEAARGDLRPIGAVLGALPRFEPKLAATLVDALRSIDTRPQHITTADRAQTQLIELLVAHDHHAAAFLMVYHGITVAVIDAIARGQLGPAPFFERLAGRFAERHFDGLKAELGVDDASDAARYQLWRPSFAFDNLPPGSAQPLGQKPAMAHFTVGMCCHINLDLAVALDETIRELGYAGDPDKLAAVERGHNFVDTILADKVEHSFDKLAAEMACPMSKRIIDGGAVKPVGDISMAMIRRWRAKTYPQAVELSTARTDDERAALRLEIYQAGARKTVRLFNTLPSLIEGTLSGAWWGAATAGDRAVP